MHRYYEELKKNHLFDGINKDEMKYMGECFKTKINNYPKNAYIFSDGDIYENLGIIAKGIVNIIKDDSKGNTVILEQAESGAVLDESINVKNDYKVNVSAKAVVNCDVVSIPFEKLLVVCKQNCPFHVRLVGNIVRMIASNHNALTQKMDYLSKKGVRDKIVSFLGFQKEKHKSNEFAINFDRKELSEFLFVERSALSRELSRMRKEKLITFKKNRFKIIKTLT